jgi:hypothetical protein
VQEAKASPPKTSKMPNAAKSQMQQKVYFNIGACDLARHMHKKIWDII